MGKYNTIVTTRSRAGESSPRDPESQSPGRGSLEDSAPREDQPLLRAPDEATWSPPRGFLWIELAIMANVFLYGFDSTITAATYAVISSEFDSANTASWLTTSYLVTSTAFQPLYGRVSDIFGRRICFFISTITFAAGCLGCGLAKNVVLLNCMRALTGFGGGGLMTMGESTQPVLCRSASVNVVSSNNCQLRHDPLSQARHVPSSPEQHLRIWCNLRGFFRWDHCRPCRLAMVFPRPGSNFYPRLCSRLPRRQEPTSGFCLRQWLGFHLEESRFPRLLTPCHCRLRTARRLEFGRQ